MAVVSSGAEDRVDDHRFLLHPDDDAGREAPRKNPLDLPGALENSRAQGIPQNLLDCIPNCAGKISPEPRLARVVPVRRLRNVHLHLRTQFELKIHSRYFF